MSIQLLNIGFGNMVSANRVIAIISPESAPIKRMVQDARDKSLLIDATYGRKTRAVLVMDSGQIVLSAIQPETGGTGAPVNQILILSGWDTADNSGLSPGEIMPIRTQNQLIQAVLRDYISRNPTSEREIYGSISDARYQQSSHIFTIKIKSAIYTTSITTSGEISYIKDTNGDRNVAI